MLQGIALICACIILALHTVTTVNYAGYYLGNVNVTKCLGGEYMEWLNEPTDVTPNDICSFYVCYDRECDKNTCGARLCILRACKIDI